MKPLVDVMDMRERLNRAMNQASRRNDMVKLCNDIYLMQRERSSSFLGSKFNDWRILFILSGKILLL